METKWLEDFVSLAETRSFSRSAQLRHITQPAFSRRIQALESWAGIDLVDRSSFPTRLTTAGVTLHAQALEILSALQTTRNMMRGHQAAGQDMVEFAVPHTLAFTFFPHWLLDLRQDFGALKSRLITLNVHDAVLRLTEGGCDLLIAYHHAAQPLSLSLDRYEMISLGSEVLAPFARPGPGGGPMFALPGRAGTTLPFLNFGAGAYMARLVDVLLQQTPPLATLETVYETDMAEGLKAMALEGHGLAFLPTSSVRKEVEAGRLVRAAPPERFELTMDMRIYREKPGLARHVKASAQALWQYLSDAARVAAAAPALPQSPHARPADPHTP